MQNKHLQEELSNRKEPLLTNHVFGINRDTNEQYLVTLPGMLVPEAQGDDLTLNTKDYQENFNFIQSLKSHPNDLSVEVSVSMEMGKEYTARIDFPVVGIASNESNNFLVIEVCEQTKYYLLKLGKVEIMK